MELVTGRSGSPHITAQQDRQLHQGIFGDGAYILNTGNMLEPEVQSSNSIHIKDGALMFQGALFSVKVGTYDEVTINNGNQGMKRKDVIAVKYTYDSSENIEAGDWTVVQGTPVASNPVVPDMPVADGDIQAGDSEVYCPVFVVTLDGINVTGVDVIPEMMQDMSTINKYLAELLPKTINASALALLSHWQVMTADVWKEADTVHINMEIYTSAVIQANHLYTINTPASTDPDVRPAKLSFLSVFATDAAYGNTVAVTGMVTPAGAIQISLPNASRPYVFITGEYRTAN